MYNHFNNLKKDYHFYLLYFFHLYYEYLSLKDKKNGDLDMTYFK